MCLGRISAALMDTERQRAGKPRRRQRSSGARAAAAAPVAPASLGLRPTIPQFQQQANMSSTTKESLTEATFASFELSAATLR